MPINGLTGAVADTETSLADAVAAAMLLRAAGTELPGTVLVLILFL